MANPILREHNRHLALVDTTPAQEHSTNQAGLEELETAPLFTTSTRLALKAALRLGLFTKIPSDYPQYGLLGYRQGIFKRGGYGASSVDQTEHNMVYANVNAPWSAFICGSQGSGKSHTLSCILESCILSPPPAGCLPKPLAGIVFHYDKFTSTATTQLCEAAYLCSAGVPVRILVSPSNFKTMQRLYSNLPGLRANTKRPRVLPMYFQERNLNVFNILTLMSVNDTGTSKPLYLGVLCQILRDMAIEQGDRPGINYQEFKSRLESAGFSRDQQGPLVLRLQLLESFLDLREKVVGSGPSSNIWHFEPGSVTIVDLSDPFVDANDACALFSICLGLFMEQRGQTGRVIALDEAHKVRTTTSKFSFRSICPLLSYETLKKSAVSALLNQFLTQSGEALHFTDNLLSVIRQQRHLATRVLIATQEPTLAPSLVDLCDVTIVHRFRSPDWFGTLKRHLPGIGLDGTNDSGTLIPWDPFATIVGLQTGEALLFAPAAVLDVSKPIDGEVEEEAKDDVAPLLEKLNDAYIRIRIRTRLTHDGGKSVMATNTDGATTPQQNQPPSLERLLLSSSSSLREEEEEEEEEEVEEEKEEEEEEDEGVIAVASSRFNRPARGTRGRGRGGRR